MKIVFRTKIKLFMNVFSVVLQVACSSKVTSLDGVGKLVVSAA